MSEWEDVVSENALANGEKLVVDVDGNSVVLCKIADSYYAIANICSHDGSEIASGTLDGEEIICPRHGARFCVKTGQVKSPPAYEDIDCFLVRVEQGKIQIRDNRFDM
jgi:3-phenylpropionate/trans-cinnamate dioxygenase ferredoxin subunit